MVSEQLGEKKLIRCSSCHTDIPENAEHHMVVNKGGFVSLLCGFCYISNKENVIGLSKEILTPKPKPINSKARPWPSIKSWSRQRKSFEPGIENIYKEYLQGADISSLANKYNTCKSVLYRRFRSLKENPIYGHKYRKRFSPELLEQVRREHADGAVYKTLSKKYNISPATISRNIKAGPKPKLNPEQIKELLEKYTAGARPDSIAAEYNISNTLLYKYLNKLDPDKKFRLHRGPRHLLSPDKVNSLVNDYKSSDLSTESLASKYNISRSTVQRYLYANGITGSASRLPNPLPLEAKKQIAADYQAGLMPNELYKKYPYPPREIFKLLDVIRHRNRNENEAINRRLFTPNKTQQLPLKKLSFREKLIKLLGGK